MSFISKVIENKDSFDLREHADGILLLLIKGEHCSEKWELKISVSCLKSVIYLLSWKIGGITGNNIFLLFRKVFNMDQYVLGLVLGSNNLFTTFE